MGEWEARRLTCRLGIHMNPSAVPCRDRMAHGCRASFRPPMPAARSRPRLRRRSHHRGAQRVVCLQGRNSPLCPQGPGPHGLWSAEGRGLGRAYLVETIPGPRSQDGGLLAQRDAIDSDFAEIPVSGGPDAVLSVPDVPSLRAPLGGALLTAGELARGRDTGSRRSRARGRLRCRTGSHAVCGNARRLAGRPAAVVGLARKGNNRTL
jgi:hypothetical protein